MICTSTSAMRTSNETGISNSTFENKSDGESTSEVEEDATAFVNQAVAQGLEHFNVTPDNASKFKLTTTPDLFSKDNRIKAEDKSVSDSNSEMLSGEIDSSVQHEVMVNYPSSKQTQVSSYRIPREHVPRSNSFIYPKKKSRKVRPGQYVSGSKAYTAKNKNRKSWSDYIKSAVDSSDSNIAWSYWEYEDEEPDEADDSKTTTKTTKTTTTPSTTTTTTTTTTTPAPTTTTTTAKDKTTSSVTVHKHFHYFKKAAPWAGDPWKGDKAMAMPTSAPPMPPPMPMEEMMKMTDDMMEEMMMKGMMMIPPHDDQDKKKGGISGIFDKLSKVEPITILVAGIIPASLILAAALPSVMSKMMPMKGDTNTMPMMPTIMTTAVDSDGGMDMMGSRSIGETDSLAAILESVGEFGLKALEKPHCARMMFCRLAAENLIAESPIMQKAVHLASVAMEDSWLQHVGVQSLFKSLNDGTCNQEDCDPEFLGNNLVAT